MSSETQRIARHGALACWVSLYLSSWTVHCASKLCVEPKGIWSFTALPIGVNLGIFHDILWQHLYKCRPAGAWVFGLHACYTDAVPPGLKSPHLPDVFRTICKGFGVKTFFYNEKYTSFFLNWHLWVFYRSTQPTCTLLFLLSNSRFI